MPDLCVEASRAYTCANNYYYSLFLCQIKRHARDPICPVCSAGDGANITSCNRAGLLERKVPHADSHANFVPRTTASLGPGLQLFFTLLLSHLGLPKSNE